MIRLALVLAMLFAAPAQAQQVDLPPLTDADYFAFADRIAAEMDTFYREDTGRYHTGARSIDTICSAAMLTVYATAAAHGHIGPARDDARAVRLARALTASPPYYTAAAPPRYDKMFHTPGWTSNMDGPYVDMDKSIDPKVAEGLQIAYRARDVLGLDAETARRIREQIRAVAYTEFFRYPKVRLNQINWHAELYAYDALVNEDATLLQQDYRQHVHAFTQGFKTPQIAGGATNVGPSYRFIYQSNGPENQSRNVDSAEYANMTLHFIYWHDLARAAGMAALPDEDIRLLRGWTQRALYGYWTHAGFMNWDTGWSFERWMKGKAWAYGMQGLIAVATSPTFQTRSSEARWAKYVFDRGLRLYEHLSYQAGARAPFRPSAELFHIGEQGTPSSTMFWARMAANAARAVSAGMGRMPASAPPAFYAYDADIGRLAVSTKRYSTAILAVPRGTIPYGGLDLARLYDGEGDPIGGTGGRPPASFGVVVNDARGRRLVASQVGHRKTPARPPLTLTRSPLGRITRQKVLAERPDAGPIGSSGLAVTGSRSANGVSVTSSYTFRERSITGTWTVRRPRGRRPVEARVLFPTWGRATRIETRPFAGAPAQLAVGRPAALTGVREFVLHAEYGSYRVVLSRELPGAMARLYAPRRQGSNPRGGPTLALSLPPLTRGTRSVTATIYPSSSGGLVPDPEKQPYVIPSG